ncbi:MAG: HEAT repeat domain-containing protein [Deltaproteobacteria bacterium]|nr:HEAT repeat domain-containing protein [Deltaproteobacteria bacterium]MBW1928320.1 HEAT repeat domain-containing protein [Deltaproteobacteria bacterium]MBW2026855.1 HEAT repeat domain-containing protein [Deltaproteobacteria bacterium]MBW2126835.1 HEAT repeat domain-containing protein [Deltaproteobacteria bacterium]RLB24253.1 MAG: hypothetical protein DRG76_01970 [Deltaproteobacteria bacterium]
MSLSIADLLKHLNSEDATDRRYAAEDLGDLNHPAAIPALIKALEDPVVAVREAAVDSLITIGGKDVCEQVIPLLGSDDAWLRNYATEILEQIGVDAVEGVRKLCESPSSDIRKFALDVLGKIGELTDVDAFEEIAARLDDENVNVAAAAAEALGRIGDPAAIPILADYVYSSPWLQCNVIHAIYQIGGDGARQVIENIDPEKLSSEAQPYYETAKTLLGVRG